MNINSRKELSSLFAEVDKAYEAKEAVWREVVTVRARKKELAKRADHLWDIYRSTIKEADVAYAAEQTAWTQYKSEHAAISTEINQTPHWL